ncbi:biotin/lipoyl-binding carrier protein [uncultured Sneathiella sp.]|jgi:acetyl-CoA carboxylase biotin carboxyl carrier protein|uniref:biotin/lipoyl-binding carrier protein n=1 Tax=uncultured Sneathiella sp. TaxID=879315 RepID=UPI0030DCDB87|tara:strand:+ start:240 stop:461 length:222 start_codon:yes stop_codon:yes gene_type:complete
MALIDVIAEVTGKVWKIEAAVGQELEEDDDVVILESMKMEIPVGAPEDGTLKEILVGEGDSVSEGQVIARIET